MKMIPILLAVLGLAGLAVWVLKKLKANPLDNTPEIGSGDDSWRELSAFLIELEGMRYQPYMDSAGHLTTGVGHKITPAEMFYLDRPLLAGEVMDLLYEDVQKVLPVLEGLEGLTKGQKIAIISFAFNVGNTAFLASTLYKKLLSGDESAVAEFQRWVYVTNPKTGAKEVSEGLQNRRNKEIKMFRS